MGPLRFWHYSYLGNKGRKMLNQTGETGIWTVSAILYSMCYINVMWKYWNKIKTVIKSIVLLTSRASLTSSLWLEWTRCLRAHRACCTTPCWWCARTSRVGPASAAVWALVFQGESSCTISTCNTTVTWILKRLEGVFNFILFLLYVFSSSLIYNMLSLLRQ